VPYVWVLWDLFTSSINPLRADTSSLISSSAYDFQARAILHGHLSLPTGSIGEEAFVHDGHQYTYFGIFPSLIRIPILLVTHSLDGRLTAISMLGAWLATALFATLLLWRIRVAVRGDALLGWAETASYSLLLFSILAGSVLVYLASQPNQYSEDLAWSIALACGSLFALVGVVERPSWGRVVASGVLILFANLNRATTGYACVLAAVGIAVWFGLGRAGSARKRWAAPMLMAALIAMLAGCVIDLAKFGLFFGVPSSEQLLYAANGLSHFNGGHYFGLRFLPSTLQAYVNPGNFRLTSVFPFVTLPDVPNYPIGHPTVFQQIPTASVLTAVPLLSATGLFGVITAFTPHQQLEVRALRILLIATAATAGSVMIFGWILERFSADFVPLLALASMIGMVDIWHRLTGKRRRTRVIASVTFALLALFGFVSNMGFAVTPDVNWTRTQLAHYVEFQQSISDVTGHPLTHDVIKGSEFPPQAPMGQLFIKGRCNELYVADQAVPKTFYEPNLIWLLVERAPHAPICHSLIPFAKSIIVSLTTKIVIPLSQETVSGPDVTVSASTSGRASSALILISGTSARNSAVLKVAIRSHSVWIFTWNSQSLPNGVYALRSVASDAAGYTAVSPVVTVTVDNARSGH
jgi:hypothetical protein